MAMSDFKTCSRRIKLTAEEYRYVEEIPGVEMWWFELGSPDHQVDQCQLPQADQQHFTVCYEPPADKYTVTCCQQEGHEGEHAALVGVFMETELDQYIFWQHGVPGARAIRQPGTCTAGDEHECCQLFAGHHGDHLLA
jgi:hypothetical protein